MSQLWDLGQSGLEMDFETRTSKPSAGDTEHIELKYVQSHMLVSAETNTTGELILDSGRYSNFGDWSDCCSTPNCPVLQEVD